VFVALRATIARHDIPARPFLDLIDAFEQDQSVNRYQTFEQVVDYCRRSADPVGRLVLYMCGYRDEERQRLSDRTCTALQLANFWQDVRRDWVDRNRIYLPQDSMARFGVTEEQLAAFRFDDNFRRLMQFEVRRTHELLDEGERLLPLLAPVYRRQISLFGQGGRAILRAIERRGYDTLTSRPSLSKGQKARLVLKALAAAVAQKLSPGVSKQGADAR
jgi:squalene synthase HpnC